MSSRAVDRGLRFLGECLLVSWLTIPMLAQFTTARLAGSVVDPSGAGVGGAKVTVNDELTSYTNDTTTNSSGEYVFPSLPVGTYRMSVTMPGFTSYVQSGIVLQVGQSVNLPVQMKLGAVTEQVTVNADASMVTTDSATVGQLITQKEVVELPLNGRYAQQLVFLVPGAQNVTANYCAANCEGGVFPSEQYAKVNAAAANGVSYQLDGADFNDTYINTNLPFPSPDAIQEFNLVSDNMSAVYGDALGGVVNVTLKAGTNSIHGGVFEFLRNNVLDAANYFSTTGVSPLKQNQFGGDIGGPIVKNRLFFFGSYQGTRFSSSNAGQIQFVPDAAERTGNFSELLSGPSPVQLVNPTTGAPFANNQIPVNPVAAFILKGVPLPNPIPGQSSNAFNFSSLPTVQNTNEYLIKLDYNFGKHHLSGHYFQQNYTQPLVVPTTDYLQMTGNSETLIDHNVSVVDIYTISPHFLLGSYYGYTKIDGTTYASSPFTMADAGAKIAVPPTHGAGNIASLNVGISGGFGLGSGNYGVWNRGDQSLREIATLTKGKHVLQFGGEAKRLTQPMGNTFQQGGTFDFGSLTGNGLADFELGFVQTFIQGGGLYLNFTGINWSAFVHDDWRATPRLTISAGLRWDPFIPSKDSLGRVACFESGAARSARYPNAPLGLLYGGSHHDPGCPEAAIFNNLFNLGPRFGFAYQATKDGKTSVRGGVGYYYEPPNSLIYQQIVGVPPFAPIFTLTNVSLSDPYGSAGVPNPFPASFGPRNPPSNVTFSGPPSFSQIQDPHLRLPMILGWNLTVERGFGSNWLLRAAYVGNDGHRLYGTGDQESGLLQLNPAIYNPAESPLENLANTQQRRVNPNFGSVASINSGVNSNYNALQLTAEKRFGHGFSLLSSFAWSKAMDDYAPQPQGSLASMYTNTCSCGRKFDYGPSADDLNKVFKINGDYEIPHIHVERIADKLLNGWQLTAIADWQTGLPFTIFSGVDNSFSAIGEDRADLTVPNIGDAVLPGRSHRQSIQEWFNVNDFTLNAIGTFGNTRKNALRGPRFFDTDLALIKRTQLSERVSLSFRAEFFNAFNNVNFGLPGNNVAAGVSGGLGQITGTAGSGSYNGPTSYGTAQPRIIQFGLKANF
ncbi:MAG: carboxypeptidase regulatory-like domain-containing protein [Acidobacteria bacterium]|nr:carboxypeptidase regulatory-like domain-containing protein [Acidobacteriota bacterium]